jgi:hypothetical protein
MREWLSEAKSGPTSTPWSAAEWICAFYNYDRQISPNSFRVWWMPLPLYSATGSRGRRPVECLAVAGRGGFRNASPSRWANSCVA